MSENDLTTNKTDYAVSLGKAATGWIPFCGPLIAELIGTSIPNQRMDRLQKYVIELEQRLTEINEEKLKELLKLPEVIDLIEESFIQASRTITDERRKEIALLVKNGLNDEKIAYSEAKHLLRILNELNEQEIIWLKYYSYSVLGYGREFMQQHKNVLFPKPPSLTMSDPKVLNEHTLKESFKTHLERLGLISLEYKIDKKTGLPVFDKKGQPEVSGAKITKLGKLLLSQIEIEQT